MTHIQPNFIIAGEGKAGTTALYTYLAQHHDVFMCEPKEPRYFAFRNRRPDYSGPMDEEWFNSTTIYEHDDYYKLFEMAGTKLAIGEASPIYMHMQGCAAAIAEELPGAKIIILLRNPAQLTFSAYQHMVSFGYEPLSFEDALLAEAERTRLNWCLHWRYSKIGFVAGHVEEFLQYFSREQILFINYDDFKRDNFDILLQVCDFLGISSDFKFSEARVNINTLPRLTWMRTIQMTPNHRVKRILRPLLSFGLRRIYRVVSNLNTRPKKEKINQDTYRKLLAMYDEDIRKCQELTGMNLDDWLATNKILLNE